jgi:hypothetical protein
MGDKREMNGWRSQRASKELQSLNPLPTIHNTPTGHNSTGLSLKNVDSDGLRLRIKHVAHRVDAGKYFALPPMSSLP